MCTISGFISFGKRTDHFSFLKMIDICIKGEQRGRDAFGFYEQTIEGFGFSGRYLGKASDYVEKKIARSENIFLFLANNRAEPTTEWFIDKTENDIQPYESKECIAVHNGVIANDKELAKRDYVNVTTSVDSAVIPWLFDGVSAKNYKKAIDILQNDLIGSYALSVYNKKTETLYLATNYKPLSLSYNKEDDILFFSSLESFMIEDDINMIYGKEKVMEVKPYTLLVIHKGDRKIHSFSLRKKKGKKKKALIIASAGLDSTVCASWAQAEGYDIGLLHFAYKCRAEKKEREAIQLIAEKLNAPLIVIPADFFKNTIGGSRLTNPEEVGDLVKDRGGIASAELAHEWVPARNLIFMSIAAGYAEAHEYDYIVLGGNLEESGSYSDNELIFQQKFNDLLPNALNLQSDVQVLMPVADLMKHEIVALGLKVNAPLDLTWSCYEAGDLHCGCCGPCFMRKTAFKMLGENEVIKYQTDG